jgi:hypothetical protein
MCVMYVCMYACIYIHVCVCVFLKVEPILSVYELWAKIHTGLVLQQTKAKKFRGFSGKRTIPTDQSPLVGDVSTFLIFIYINTSMC